MWGIFMEKEIWKDIKGYEGKYQISNIGRVKSLKRKCKSNNSFSRTVKEIVKKQTKCSTSGLYRKVKLYKDADFEWILVHRLVASAFLDNPLIKPMVNHKNSIPYDNRVENLEWVTASENNKHGYDFGSHKKVYGEQHKGSKLKKFQVDEIRKKYIKNVYGMMRLAKEYKVCYYTIWDVINNNTWKEII